jgi:hypothetical protein
MEISTNRDSSDIDSSNEDSPDIDSTNGNSSDIDFSSEISPLEMPSMKISLI